MNNRQTETGIEIDDIDMDEFPVFCTQSSPDGEPSHSASTGTSTTECIPEISSAIACRSEPWKACSQYPDKFFEEDALSIAGYHTEKKIP